MYGCSLFHILHDSSLRILADLSVKKQIVECIQTAKSGVYQEINKALIPLNYSAGDNGLEKVKQENFAYISDSTYLSRLGCCDIGVVVETRAETTQHLVWLASRTSLRIPIR